MKQARAIVAVLPLLLTGCLSGTIKYDPPYIRDQLPNSVTVDRPIESVWKASIPELGRRFFVINTMDRSSGLINMSYSGDPEQYIDCGRIEIEVENARGRRAYTFAGATGHKTYEVVQGGRLIFADRTMKLEGRINLIFVEISPDRTRVTANTRYVVTRVFQWREVTSPITGSTDTISFNFGEAGAFPDRGAGALQCKPTGRLEGDVLDLIK